MNGATARPNTTKQTISRQCCPTMRRNASSSSTTPRLAGAVLPRSSELVREAFPGHPSFDACSRFPDTVSLKVAAVKTTHPFGEERTTIQHVVQRDNNPEFAAASRAGDRATGSGLLGKRSPAPFSGCNGEV